MRRKQSDFETPRGRQTASLKKQPILRTCSKERGGSRSNSTQSWLDTRPISHAYIIMSQLTAAHRAMLGQASCTWTGTCLLQDCHSSAPHTARTIQPEATLRLQSKPCQNRSCPTAHCHIPPTATLPPHRHPSSSYERSRKCKSDGSLYGTNTTTLLRRFCAHPPLYMPPRSTDLRTTYL